MARKQFVALRQDPQDDAQTSDDMVNQGGGGKHDSGSGFLPRCWQKDDEREWNFRTSLSPFPWKTFFVVATLLLALAPVVVLAVAAEAASIRYIYGRDCYPNGSWKLADGATWRIMDSSYFFTPNLSFGAFTFSQVKVIDIAWDLIVGRCGQILLAWVNYRVFNEWLVYHMEMHFTSYKMYAAVAFETTTLTTLGVLGKEFLAFGDKSWKRFFRWLGMLSMLLSTLYVLSFPTLMGALTGYITTYKLYVESYDHNLFEGSQINRVKYVINDAYRLGYNKPLVIRPQDTALVEYIEIYLGKFSQGSSPSDSGLRTSVGNGSSTWEFEGSKPINLTSPILSITRYLFDSFHDDLEQLLADYNDAPIFSSWIGYTIGGDFYNATYIREHGSCKPSETYQWGFSYIFLFMVSIFNFLWACISVCMWLDTRRGSRMYKSGRRPGLLRSIMDYSAAIREELGSQVEYLDEEELRR